MGQNDDKLDGGGLGLTDVSELADLFQSIAEIFARMARAEMDFRKSDKLGGSSPAMHLTTPTARARHRA
jgi:hypothetical protein